MSVSKTREACAYRLGEVVRLSGKGWSAPQIANQLGINLRTVTRYRQQAGISQPAKVPYTEEELQRAEALLADGCSMAETARTLGRGGGIYNHPRLKGKAWTTEQAIEHVVATRKLLKVLK